MEKKKANQGEGVNCRRDPNNEINKIDLSNSVENKKFFDGPYRGEGQLPKPCWEYDEKKIKVT